MIITRLIGGLGNQLFQYALGRHLADIHRTELKLDISGFQTYTLHKYSLGVFNIAENFATDEDVERLTARKAGALEKLHTGLFGRKPKRASTHIREKKVFRFDKRILKSPDNVLLEGYWQSEKYFKAVSDILRKEFTVRSPQAGKDKEVADVMASKEAVCVHIRRGDYVTNEKTREVHGVCSLNYYSRCMDRMSETIKEPHFFVFSDDPRWARENVKHACPVTIVDHNNADRNYEDLRLMSQCKHYIIANSSFSWWGAWLNASEEDVVFAPRVWYAKIKDDLPDVTPARWLRV